MPRVTSFKDRARALLASVGLIATCAGCSGEDGDAAREPVPPTEEQLADLLDNRVAPAPIVLDRFAKVNAPSVRTAFFEELPTLVERLPLLERRRLLARWSADTDVELRRAAGRALQSSFVALGAAEVVHALATDTDEAVRRNATVAAMIRRVPLAPPRAYA